MLFGSCFGDMSVVCKAMCGFNCRFPRRQGEMVFSGSAGRMSQSKLCRKHCLVVEYIPLPSMSFSFQT